MLNLTTEQKINHYNTDCTRYQVHYGCNCDFIYHSHCCHVVLLDNSHSLYLRRSQTKDNEETMALSGWGGRRGDKERGKKRRHERGGGMEGGWRGGGGQRGRQSGRECIAPTPHESMWCCEPLAYFSLLHFLWHTHTHWRTHTYCL